MIKILDTKNEKADSRQVVEENCAHLSSQENSITGAPYVISGVVQWDSRQPGLRTNFLPTKRRQEAYHCKAFTFPKIHQKP